MKRAAERAFLRHGDVQPLGARVPSFRRDRATERRLARRLCLRAMLKTARRAQERRASSECVDNLRTFSNFSNPDSITDSRSRRVSRNRCACNSVRRK
eukprot:4037709-Pleurochrysis_carterae.AAC.1